MALRTGRVPQPGDDDAVLRRLLADEERAMLIDRSLALRRRLRRNGRRCAHGSLHCLARVSVGGS